MYTSVGHNLRMIRFKKNLTQTEVAKANGINESTLGRYENDKVEQPKMKVLEKLADFYEVPINEIIFKDNASLKD